MSSFSFTYPRPQMQRSSFLSLDGIWELAFSAKREVPDVFPFRITLPFPPESALSGVKEKRKKGELLYYRRTFSLPKGFHKEKTLLHFGAVDQVATVLLNGSPLFTNEGGYLPFSVDITAHLSEENTLIVAVEDDLKRVYPYGKQREKRGGMWYTPISGIWQTVWLESYPKRAIYDIRVTSDRNCARISVESDAPSLTLTYQDGEETVSIPFEKEITVSPKSQCLWTPESPFLYHFTVESDTDKAKSYFALRELTAEKAGKHTRFFLNGDPIFLHGVLDQGYFHDGIYTPKSPEEYEKDILRVKALGFNLLRKHIKIEPAIFYALCDAHGLMVCQDAVNNGKYSFLWHTALPTVFMKSLPNLLQIKSKKERAFFLSYTEKTIDYVTRFPSVLLFTVFNEGWGQRDGDALYKRFKSKYPSLLFDTASGWFHPKRSDVESIHVYFKRVKARYKCRRLPVFLSEFGGYSLNVSGHMFNERKSYGYAKCQTGEQLEEMILSLYREQVIPAIFGGLSGAVYTQITDVEDETNGFYTADRAVLKISEKRFAALRQELEEALKKSLNTQEGENK